MHVCLGDGADSEKVEIVADEAHDSSSSDGDAEGHNEAQYRITVPLDVRLAAPAPVFAAAAPTHSLHTRLSTGPPPPSPPTHSDIRPLMSVDVTSLPPPTHLQQQQQQQLVLPVSTPAPLIIRPRCRDYDGESCQQVSMLTKQGRHLAVLP